MLSSGAREEESGVAPGMGRKSKVKVLLESRQTESNTEDKGGAVRCRLVEVVGAARNRAKAKHRKAFEPRVSQPPVVKPESVERPEVLVTAFVRNFLTLTRGDLPASVATR